MTERAEEIVLRLDKPPNCPQCDGESLLLARFPHTWRNANGEVVPGMREALLCRGCSRGEQPADELIALFTVDELLDHNNVETFGELAAAWVESVRHRTADQAMLADEEECWRRGDL
ncbi:DUF6300 family protein [Streptomyces inhibens]|uniref:DUF6300 family protein n=1 Tax=Streptomyces inhibens TaxID=2293571 RepID=UPI00402AFEBF